MGEYLISGSKTIFNSSEWSEVLKKSYGLEVRVINPSKLDRPQKFENRSQKSEVSFQSLTPSPLHVVEGGIPFAIKKNKYISLPFSDYVNLLDSKNENDCIITELLKKIPNIEIEIRAKYEGNGFETKLVGHKHSLNLFSSENEIFKSFKKTQVQQPIQKSIRDGLKAEIKNDYESINEFYKLHLLTRKKLGVPIQPKKFFYYLWYEIISKGMGYVVLVRLNEKVISSGIFIGFNKILTYKFSSSHPGHLKYRPNNLMLWSGIQEAKKRGYELFDFGRTDLDTDGLRKFKLGWGTIEEPLFYSYYPKVPKGSKFKFIKDKIVSPIIRNSPKLVCRWSGELLYKYFG